MLPRYMLAALLSATLAMAPACQSCIAIPTNTPNLGAPSQVPFGNNNPSDPIFSDTRYQVLVPASLLGNQTLHICDLQVAPAGTRLRQFHELTVTLAHNPTGQLGNPMSQNLVGASQTASTHDWLLPTTANNWTPLGLGFDFTYTPANGDLVIEFRVRGAGALTGSGTAGLRTDQALPYGWTAGGGESGSFFSGGGIKVRLCTDTFSLLELGGGCPGSSGVAPALTYTGSAQRGGPGFDTNLSQAPPGTAIAALLWSFDLQTHPVDLTIAGAPGCTTHMFGDIATAVPVTAGSASFSFAPPATVPACVLLWNQWFVIDATANALGLTTSNPGRIVVGG